MTTTSPAAVLVSGLTALVLGTTLLTAAPSGAVTPAERTATGLAAPAEPSPTAQPSSQPSPQPSPTAEPTTGAAPAPRPTRPRATTFQIATFNQLGSQHTRRGSSYAPGTRRARITAGIVRDRGVEVVGFQEVQKDQLRVLRKRLRGYRVWPRLTLGNQGVRLQIAWRAKRFEKVSHGRITTTFDHQRRPIPFVQLRERRSGARFYVIDIHNSPRGQEAARDRATRQQVRLVRRLRETGRAVFILGDANERREFFCKSVRATGLVASNGGRASRRGCRPPRHAIIDWILGDGRIDFLGHSQSRSRQVRRASDHHFVQATVRVARRR